jgi:hypothetical protein
VGILGQGTFVVDGQRTTLPPAAAFVPPSFGPQTSGVPNVTPSIPPMMGGTFGGATAQSGSMGYGAVGGYGTADNNALVTSIAAANPHSLTASPLWWAVGFLLGGVLLLQFVSFRETVDEHGHAGPLKESAAESAAA